jgi:hypothetical protein
MGRTILTKRRSRSKKTYLAAPSTKQPAREVNLAEEYAYVTGDLIRIAIIAAVLIGGLIVLSFFLH